VISCGVGLTWRLFSDAHWWSTKARPSAPLSSKAKAGRHIVFWSRVTGRMNIRAVRLERGGKSWVFSFFISSVVARDSRRHFGNSGSTSDRQVRRFRAWSRLSPGSSLLPKLRLGTIQSVAKVESVLAMTVSWEIRLVRIVANARLQDEYPGADNL